MNNQEEAFFDISGKRVYLASPYTHEDERVMELRYNQVVKAAGILVNRGCFVFSPIVHCHPIAKACSLPTDYLFWEEYNTSFLHYWTELFYILCLPGWKGSTGLTGETGIARKIDHISVYHILDYDQFFHPLS